MQNYIIPSLLGSALLALLVIYFLFRKLLWKHQVIKLKHWIIRSRLDYRRKCDSPDLPKKAKKCTSRNVLRFLEGIRGQEMLGMILYKADSEYRKEFNVEIGSSSSFRVERNSWFGSYAIEVAGGKVLIFRPFYARHPHGKLPLIYTTGIVKPETILETLEKFFAPRERATQRNFSETKKEVASV